MHKSKLFFSLFIVIEVVCMVSLPMQSANAQTTTETDYNLLLNHFTASLTPTSQIDANYEIAVEKLYDFENLGIFSSTDEKITFKSSIKVQLSANFFPDYTLDEVFTLNGQPVRRTDIKEGSKIYMVLETSNDFFWETGTTMARACRFYYTYYDLAAAQVAAKGFQSAFEIALGVQNFDEMYLSAKGLNVSDFKLGEIYPVTQAIRPISTTVQDLDQYKDIFIDRGNAAVLNAIDVREDATPAVPNTSNLGTANSLGYEADMKTPITTQTLLQRQINVMDLGARRLGNSTTQKQSSDIYYPTTNSPLGRTGDNKFRISLIKNIPEVIIYTDEIEYTEQTKIRVDVQDGWLFNINVSPARIVDTSSIIRNRIRDRYIGWRVNNQNIHQTYVAEMSLYSDVYVSSVEEREILLKNPEFLKGDVIWDVSLFGETASLVFTKNVDWLSNAFSFITSLGGAIIGFLIVGVVIYIAAKTFPTWSDAIINRINRK